MHNDYCSWKELPCSKQIQILISSKYVYMDGRKDGFIKPYSIKVEIPIYALISSESEKEKNNLIAGETIRALSALIENIKNGHIKL
jgi:hypothetical protein